MTRADDEGSVDPRTTAVSADYGSTPVVRRPAPGPSLAVLVAVAVVFGLILFSVLNARRTATAPAVTSPSLMQDGPAAAAPTLYIPPADPASFVQPAPAAPPSPPATTPSAVVPPQPPQIVYLPSPVATPIATTPPAPQRNTGGSVVVMDVTRAAGAPAANGGGGDDATLNTDRSRAGMFANAATTVRQGTLLPAVLETGFDSTKPGFARALVQRDVHGFDGSRVLIPRGSRLIGEFRSTVTQGQKRAVINWERLIRPDGATIDLGSPAVDPVGRNGIKAHVDSHFGARVAGALLQTVVGVGTGLATSRLSGGVLVALPGSFPGNATPATQPAQITPTLSVAPGTSISVFVARDLDFSGVDNPR